MHPEQIKSSDLLDILFADRNKSYGAYPLRRGYNKRLTKSLLLAGAIIVLALTWFYTSGKPGNENISLRPQVQVVLDDINSKEPDPPAPPPPPPPPPAPQMSIRAFTAPLITREVNESEVPPVDELEKSVIGSINRDGIDDPLLVAPPIDPGEKGIIEAPKQSVEINEFVPVEIESTYPGGMAAWHRFLLKTLSYPRHAQEQEIQGAVTVKFIVDKDGKLSNIEAIAGPHELRAEAIRVISKSGKWTPALQNGNHVKSYKVQQIIFSLQSE